MALPDHDHTSAAEAVAELEALAEEMEAAAEPAADPDQGRGALDRFVNQTVEAFGAMLLVGMVLLTFLNGLMRYLFASPIMATEEIVVVMLPWLAMSGLFLSVRRRDLISMDAILRRMPVKAQFVIETVTQILSIVACVYFSILAIGYFNMFGMDRTLFMGLQKGFYTSSLFVFGGFIALALLAQFIVFVRRGPAAPPTTLPK